MRQVLSPYFYNVIVAWFPAWLVPNLITVMGGLTCLGMGFLTVAHSSGLQGAAGPGGAAQVGRC